MPAVTPARHSRTTLLIVGSLALLPVSGCGGGSSFADFASKANDICRNVSDQIKANPPSNAAGVNQTASVFAAAIAKLKALNPPSDKQRAYQAFLAGTDQELAALRQAGSLASAGNLTQAVSVLQQQSNNNQVSAEAKAAGLTTCAQSLAPA